MNIKERFLEYVMLPTMSDENSESCPSTAKQMKLLELLRAQCESAGLSDVRLDNGYVYAKLPANGEGAFPRIGLIAHVDTSPDMSDVNISPRTVEKYDGSDIVLNETLGIVMKTADFPSLERYIGDDIIVTDGTTLLGADDKAGVAEIMDAVIRLRESGKPHGDVCIAFTPDEEIGRGADGFDVANFGADYGYTVDGGSIGEIEYENFNAASARITITGASIHPGSGKNKMINAARVACELEALMPVFDRPEHTEGYEGFFHLNSIEGAVEQARMSYIIRDHDREKFELKKKHMLAVCDFVNERYGKKIVECKISDSYYNMREMVEPHYEIIERLRRAMENSGVTPEIIPIRGGTDGARLSFMGLPCPNICTGGENFHGKFEFIPVQKLYKVSDILLELLTNEELYK